MTVSSNGNDLSIASPVNSTANSTGGFAASGFVAGGFLSQTQVPFELPQGLWVQTQDSSGKRYRLGYMRLATTADELVAQRAAEMMDNQAYGVLVRLSRVVSLTERLGMGALTPDDLGHLFMPDLNYLIELYNDINPPDYELSLMGEPRAIPGSA